MRHATSTMFRSDNENEIRPQTGRLQKRYIYGILKSKFVRGVNWRSK